jgi:hypothetical protein
MSSKAPGYAKSTDCNAQIVSQTVQSLLESKKLRLPRSGYVLRMEGGRVIVAPVIRGFREHESSRG